MDFTRQGVEVLDLVGVEGFMHTGERGGDLDGCLAVGLARRVEARRRGLHLACSTSAPSSAASIVPPSLEITS